MEKILTAIERQSLIQRHRKERDGRVRDRIKAVLAYDEGYNYSQIARLLLLDDETIRRYIDEYTRVKKLEPKNGGSDGKLSDQETLELTTHLKEITYLYVKDICLYVLKTYKKKYSVSGMTKWLHANHFGYKKAHGVPAKADQEKQKEFIRYYSQLKRKAGKKEPIYFIDSVHPQHQTELTYGWIFKGDRKEIPLTASQKRLNVIGGICLEGHRFTYHQTDWVDSSSICEFLLKLRKANPDSHWIHVILDNARVHKNKEVHEFAEKWRIKLHYLPPYSPNLNPIERVWKLMHEHVRYNKYYGKFSEFTESTLDFFKGIGRKKKLLQKRITDCFQILHSPCSQLEV